MEKKGVNMLLGSKSNHCSVGPLKSFIILNDRKRRLAEASFFFAMKKLSVYLKLHKERIVCVCLRTGDKSWQRNRLKCKGVCEKDFVFYDEYRDILECFSKNKEVKWSTTRSSTTVSAGRKSGR